MQTKKELPALKSEPSGSADICSCPHGQVNRSSGEKYLGSKETKTELLDHSEMSKCLRSQSEAFKLIKTVPLF